MKDLGTTLSNSAKRALRGERVSIDRNVREGRLELCKACSAFDPCGNRCKECGCFMMIKTWFADAKCPLNKWESK